MTTAGPGATPGGAAPPAGPRVIDVTDAEGPAVRRFLEGRVETSLFLLSNLRAFGPRMGESPYSGDFRALVDGQTILAVWCVTRNGSVLIQADGHAAHADVVDADMAARGADVRFVLGDWAPAARFWALVRERQGLVPTQESREVLYRLVLPAPAGEPPAAWDVRTLTVADADAWDPLAAAFLREQRLPLGTPGSRRAGFATSAGNGHWWGAWDGGALVSIASFNAYHHPVAQVGGVYTLPARRRQGFARAVMQTILRDAVADHGLERGILFTGEGQRCARALDESL
ncbi:MAG: GNAT family N-acetyltransferase, partial [Vicinamibacterales bacterium]